MNCFSRACETCVRNSESKPNSVKLVRESILATARPESWLNKDFRDAAISSRPIGADWLGVTTVASSVAVV